MIGLGDISCLREKVKPDSKKEHSELNRQEDVTFAYHRDRKEPLRITESVTNKDINSFLDTAINSSAEYVYLFDEKDNRWEYASIPFFDDEEIVFKDLGSSLLEEQIDIKI